MTQTVRASLTVLVVALVALVATASNAAAVGVPESAALSDYATSAGFHWDTTGAVTSGYSLQTTLGFLSPTSVAGTSPIYSCQDSSSTDVHFLSLDGNCDGETGLGTPGYIYNSVHSGQASTPLYSCSDGPDRFASTDASCGGDTVVGPLGYLLLSQALDRYNGGYHWVTTGTAPSGYSLEATLGYLVTNANGAEALYGCETGTPSQFLSLDPTCGGQTVLGVEGWVYGAAGAGLSELDQCNQGSDYFESTASCEGQTDDGPLGWIPGQALAPPAATTTTTTTPTTSTTPATQTTPQTITATPPAQTSTTSSTTKGTAKAKPKLRLPIIMAWTWVANISHLHAIRFSRPLPAGASVTIRCTGRGCPKNLGTTATSAKRKRLKLATLLSRFKRDSFLPGQRVLITVARAGYVSERCALTIRDEHTPKFTVTY